MMRNDLPPFPRSSAFALTTSVIAALAVMVIAGCSSAGRTTTGSGTSTGADDALLQQLRDSYATTPALAMNGTMKISGAGVTVWYDAVVRRRDSLKINLTGPFGIPVGALGATPDAFQFFNAQEGEVIEGTPDRPTFAKLVQMQIDYAEMVSMLRGELPRMPAPGAYTTEEHDGVVRYTVRSDTTTESFSINRDDLTVLDYSRSRANGTTMAEEFAIIYKDFERVGGRRFPNKALVTIAGGEQRVSVTVDHVRDQIAGEKSCALILPSGIPRRRL